MSIAASVLATDPLAAKPPFVSRQFGNTCYCNSVLQALYFCRPFRENVLAYKAQQKKKENLLTCLADLFHSIATQKKKVGVIPPKKFISRLRKENGESSLRTSSFTSVSAAVTCFIGCCACHDSGASS